MDNVGALLIAQLLIVPAVYFVFTFVIATFTALEQREAVASDVSRLPISCWVRSLVPVEALAEDR